MSAVAAGLKLRGYALSKPHRTPVSFMYELLTYMDRSTHAHDACKIENGRDGSNGN
jgi:hypothetical protein